MSGAMQAFFRASQRTARVCQRWLTKDEKGLTRKPCQSVTLAAAVSRCACSLWRLLAVVLRLFAIVLRLLAIVLRLLAIMLRLFAVSLWLFAVVLRLLTIVLAVFHRRFTLMLRAFFRRRRVVGSKSP